MNKPYKVNVINNLAKKSYQKNRTSNIVAIMAVFLTTVLFTVVFSLGIGTLESIQDNGLRMSGGIAHGTIKYLTQEQYDQLSLHKSIYQVGQSIIAGMIENEKLIKRPVQIRYFDEVNLEMSFIFIKEGREPKLKDEIVLDKSTIALLGGKAEIGEKYMLECDFGDHTKEIEFTLSGYYDGDPASFSTVGAVSKEFIDTYIGNKEGNQENQYVGTYWADILFNNSKNIEEKIIQVITESGYESEKMDYGINWAYLSSNSEGQDITLPLIFGFISLLIMLTGYLIISNIFQISISNDIRFYGLLKTIGTTRKQIKKMILIQTARVCAIGITLGLIMGFVIAKLALPLMMHNIYSSAAVLSIDVRIFIFATLFAGLTVFISGSKPAKIASNVSPIEGLKYYDGALSFKKEKKSYNGAKLHKMAFSNLGRNKKRTIGTVFSIALGLILMNTIYCLFNSFSIDRFINKNINVDFQLGSVAYFRNDYSCLEDTMDLDFVDLVKGEEGFDGGGGIYTPSIEVFSKYQGLIPEAYYYNGWYNEVEGGEVRVYGMEDFVLSTLNVPYGEFEREKFDTGDYVLIGISPDDHGNVDLDESLYAVGDKIKLEYSNTDQKTQKEYEVMGIYAIGNTNDVRYSNRYITVGIPYKELARIDESPNLMSYIVNIDKTYTNNFEALLSHYVTYENINMNYESKDTYRRAFQGLQKTLFVIGGGICMIILSIGLINYSNSIFTGIVARQHEFAILKSIGMEVRQLNKVLQLESLYYIVFAITLSFIVSIAIMFGILSRLSSLISFFDFQYSVVTLVIASPLLVFIGLILPGLVCRKKINSSMIEELRDTDFS